MFSLSQSVNVSFSLMFLPDRTNRPDNKISSRFAKVQERWCTPGCVPFCEGRLLVKARETAYAGIFPSEIHNQVAGSWYRERYSQQLQAHFQKKGSSWTTQGSNRDFVGRLADESQVVAKLLLTCLNPAAYGAPEWCDYEAVL